MGVVVYNGGLHQMYMPGYFVLDNLDLTMTFVTAGWGGIC